VTTRYLAMTPALRAYLEEAALREPEPARRLREATSALPNGQWMVAPEQGQLMAFLARVIGAKRCFEIGTFTGYSALVVALALPPDGHLVTCDIDPERTALARRHWAEAGMAGKIELRLGPALATLETLLAEGAAGTFDFAFIDADTENNDAYFEGCLRLVRPGALIAIDNMLRRGWVADPAIKHSSIKAQRAFTRKLRQDERIEFSLVPITDGIALACKR
jgi:predicted O-methyltransferase YrrM